MNTHTWLITGVSSGFGYEMTRQLLERGDTVIGTVRNQDKVQGLIDQYPGTFDCRILDVTDVPAIHTLVDDAYAKHGKIDVIVSNAGYGLFGCAEELSDAEIDHIIATNLTGSIQLIRSALPHLRRQGGGRIIQISSYGGQVAFPANSMYHATKFGIEGFCEAVAQEVAQFNIGVTIVEPGGARTEFRYGSAKVAKLMPEYESCHGFLNMLDPANGLAPGDPAKMAARIIESVELEKAPLRMVLGSQALTATIQRLEERVADYKTQTELAASTDVPVGE
jgi:NAD(P)-dependent dehydrogenase (short-subunit alcohol dehydrogenase family)